MKSEKSPFGDRQALVKERDKVVGVNVQMSRFTLISRRFCFIAKNPSNPFICGKHIRNLIARLLCSSVFSGMRAGEIVASRHGDAMVHGRMVRGNGFHCLFP